MESYTPQSVVRVAKRNAGEANASLFALVPIHFMSSQTPPSHLNAITQIESAMRVLIAQGYDISSVQQQHFEWLKSLEHATPTENDRNFAQRQQCSSITELHFAKGEPEILTAEQCFPGRQYTLSPGQRDILRNRYHLTPTKTVKVSWVELFPGTNIIACFGLESCLHVDNARRKHVLKSCVVSPASEFFMQARSRDADREKTARAEGRVPRMNKVESAALEYLT
jgi:hypothetical protein